ncbi:hypothetical protein LELG_02218 [Lodderomyces elongisporus NRRL YB-4239]|uniref:Zn(2)-C6 fungal-type domain-containing protein n=1 Tax=Lodderomyces elongisporus (strain ATCC 11503 / CBS 2605 / JCM 1781 / NBRC 1676 / NRRL YB-4239) TaxID=379508 RepID=A5DXY1_LODEL|nr:hypothetical protein LELG_02218 [Lodderomyces elongisporus NRRL YB-4239]
MQAGDHSQLVNGSTSSPLPPLTNPSSQPYPYPNPPLPPPPPSSRINSFFHQDTRTEDAPNHLGAFNPGKQPVVTKLTNKHTASKLVNKTRKKRTPTSRACDACARRKVKCDPNTPCAPCVASGLSCTRNRERKKSGPKTLSKKTLDAINNLSEVIDFNTGSTPQNLARPPLPKHRSSTSATSKSPSTLEEETQLSSEYLESPPAPTTTPGSQRTSLSHSHTPNPGIAIEKALQGQSLLQQQQQQQQQQHSQQLLHQNQHQLTMPVSGNSHISPESQNLAPSSASSLEEYLVTPYYLVENIKLLSDEPAIYALVQPLTVNSVLANHGMLVNFLLANFRNQDTPLGNPHFQELNLLNHHEDSLYLSTLLIILTLNQIIAEILIKMKKQKFKDLARYPKKYLMFRPYKNFKNLCHFKVLEIFTLIEKNFIVPPIIPKVRANNGGLNNLPAHLSQYQVYYNLSLASMQLCNYYHILNLTNTLNPATSMQNAYGNEAQEHQKILFMHRAITYFHLLNVKPDDSLVPIRELYGLLFSSERYYLIFSSYKYNVNVVRNNDIILHLRSGNYEDVGYIYQLMKIVDDLGMIDMLCRNSNFNVMIDFAKPQSGYYETKASITRLQGTEPLHGLLRDVLLFKILLVRPLNLEQSKIEIVAIINSLSNVLEAADSDIFKIQISNYQSLQPLLHILKVFLEIKQTETRLNMPLNIHDQELLVRYSELLILHFPFFNNINKLIRAHKILNNWFLILSESRKEEAVYQGSEMSMPQPSTSSTTTMETPSMNLPQSQHPLLQPQRSYQSLQLQQLQQLQQQQQIKQFDGPGQAEQTTMAPMAPQTPINASLVPFHTGITPTINQPSSSFMNLPRIQLQQRVASQIDINELLRDFTESSINCTDNQSNFPTSSVQHKADDDYEDEEQDFFSIVPKNEHGHKFAKRKRESVLEHFQNQQSPFTQSSHKMINPAVTAMRNSTSNSNLAMSASQRSFLSLFNAANYVEDEAQITMPANNALGGGAGGGAGGGDGGVSGSGVDASGISAGQLHGSGGSASRLNYPSSSFFNLFQMSGTTPNNV